MLRHWFALLLGLVVALPAYAQEGPTRLDPNLPYQAERNNPVTYDVDFSVIITAPYKTKKLKVWLPIPPNDLAQEVSESQLSTFPTEVKPTFATEEVYGNRFAYFEIDSPQGGQIIRHQFKLKTWELRWNIQADKVQAVGQWPSSFDVYRKGDSQAVIVDDRFEKLLNEIVPSKGTAHAGLGSVINWVQANFEYDHHDASLSAKAEHALTKHRGHCSDYHSFCASMGRTLGVPTRVTYGINTFPKNSPSHCKLEAYLAPYGWVSFDVSETQRLAAEIKKANGLDEEARTRLIALAQQRLASGFRDNTWYLQTRGTDYELAPKASKRVSVVRTAYIEADGVPLAEPDPADKSQAAFTWMTAHRYSADRKVAYPFADWKTLETIQDKPQ